MRQRGERRNWISSATPNQRRAILASIAWVVLVSSFAVGFFVATPTNESLLAEALLFLLALALPPLVVWLAALLADEIERQREALAAIAAVAGPLIDTMAETREAVRREGPLTATGVQKAVQGAMLSTPKPDMTGALRTIAEGQKNLQSEFHRLATTFDAIPRTVERAIPAAPSVDIEIEEPELPVSIQEDSADKTSEVDVQPDIAFGLGWSDLISALDFPKDSEDFDGFRALKLALRRPQLAQLLQAAEDVLNLLSQEGVFMDDVSVDPADPIDWRNFIAGARGPSVSSVGAVRDPLILERTSKLMKDDPIFRDTALFFQRRFDAVLSEFAANAGDQEIRAMADTRSGRAFMLLSRLSGCFDAPASTIRKT